MNEAAPWLVANVDLIPPGGRVLDVAAGRGRHARYLAARGWRVHAIDRDAAALGQVGQVGRVGQVGEITTEQVDLERDGISLGSRCYQGVIVFNYLHRPLMPAIVEAVAAGGVLIYETFTIDQASRGRPRNPAFLLQHDELVTLVAPLRIVRAREGDFDGKFVASVAAIR